MIDWATCERLHRRLEAVNSVVYWNGMATVLSAVCGLLWAVVAYLSGVLG
jgi:hypothetical protein